MRPPSLQFRNPAIQQPSALPAKPDPYAEGYAAGRLGERAAVIAWLRAAAAPLPSSWVRESLALVAAAADAIERGQHIADLAPDPTADKAQLAALGAALQGQRGDQGR